MVVMVNIRESWEVGLYCGRSMDALILYGLEYVCGDVISSTCSLLHSMNTYECQKPTKERVSERI